jgi:hypothetical protein
MTVTCEAGTSPRFTCPVIVVLAGMLNVIVPADTVLPLAVTAPSFTCDHVGSPVACIAPPHVCAN